MSDVDDRVVNLFNEKAKRLAIFNISQAQADIQKYEAVVMKSVGEFHTYSVQEKIELYSSLAEFNVEILRQLLEYKKGELV